LVKVQLGDLYMVARIYGGAMRGHGAIQLVKGNRLAHVDQKALLARGKRLDGLGELAGNVADEFQLGGVLQSRALGLTLLAGLRLIVRRSKRVREKGDLIVRRKRRAGARSRMQALYAGHVRTDEQQDRERSGQ